MAPSVLRIWGCPETHIANNVSGHRYWWGGGGLSSWIIAIHFGEKGNNNKKQKLGKPTAKKPPRVQAQIAGRGTAREPQSLRLGNPRNKEQTSTCHFFSEVVDWCETS